MYDEWSKNCVRSEYNSIRLSLCRAVNNSSRWNIEKYNSNISVNEFGYLAIDGRWKYSIKLFAPISHDIRILIRFHFSFTDHSGDFRHRRRRSSAHSNTPANNNDLVYIRFSLPVDDLPLDIDESTLRLMIKNHSPHPSDSHHADQISLKIYQLIEPYGRVLVDTRTVPLKEVYPSSRWIEFDVSQAVENWKSGASNLGLEIHCAGCDGMGVHIVHDTSTYSDSPELSPVLNVVGKMLHREKRSRQHRHYLQNTKHRPRKTDCTKENHKCCRHTMDVVFKELKGYEFIIQPKNFDAGYCRGKCPPRYNPANHHALLQSLIWKHDKTKATRPCCAPSKLMELEVLHVDENDHSKLKVSTWSDMRVLECACS